MKHYNYPYNVIKDIKEYYKENENKELCDYEVEEMTPQFVLEIFLEWNGIFGYTSSILGIMNAKPSEEPTPQRTHRETYKEVLNDLNNLKNLIAENNFDFKGFKEFLRNNYYHLEEKGSETRFELSWGCGIFLIENIHGKAFIDENHIEVWNEATFLNKLSREEIEKKARAE